MLRRALVPLLAILLIWLPAAPTRAAQAEVRRWTGKVVAVRDGDTIDILRGDTTVRVRLFGVDAPEWRQAYGRSAKAFTARRVFGERVMVTERGADRYGRVLGDVEIADGRSLNRALVRAGLAWWYRQYSDDATLGELEAEARAARRGLWADAHPEAPWAFRRAKED